MRSTLWALVACSVLGFQVQAQVRLAASPFATYVDNEGEPSRLSAIVQTAFERAGSEVSLEVMRPAFLGSGLSSATLEGEFAAIDFDDPKPQFNYSKGYLPFYLYATSRNQQVTDIRLIPHLKDSRVAIENRFVNTSKMRLLKQVKWSRNPTAYDAFRQLADGRAPMLITTRLLIEEFNRLLRDDRETQLYLSAAPLLRGQFFVTLNKNYEGGAAILEDFNQAIGQMQFDGTYNQLLGVTWLSKDFDGDGVAELISSASVGHARLSPELAQQAFPLDDTPIEASSTFIIDGAALPDWSSAAAALQDADISLRPSLLDADVYERMIKRW